MYKEVAPDAASPIVGVGHGPLQGTTATALERAILNSPAVSYVATDGAGVIQVFNIGAERMLGYAASEVVNRLTPVDLHDAAEMRVHAATLSAELGVPIAPGFEALVYKAARGVEDVYALTKIRKDGSRFRARVSVTALRGPLDQLIGYLLIGTDDTERQQTEERRAEALRTQTDQHRTLLHAHELLRESEAKLEVTLNSIGDAVIATDAQARVTRLNPVAEALTGWTHAEASGRPVAEVFVIINEETREPAAIPVMETLARGTVQGLANHTVIIARGGAERAIADSCAPILDPDGRVAGAVLVFRDVTEEHASQQALRDSETQIRSILDTVVDGIVTFGAAGGVVVSANPAAERMFGDPGSALLGRTFSDLIPELAGAERSSLEAYLAGKDVQDLGRQREVQGRSVQGTLFPVEITVSEMSLRGERYFTAMLRDISARKRAEEVLLKEGALQNAIFNSANFSSIATDAKGVIQIFNVGAERMLGYAAVDVMNRITPADISDPQELIARARALTAELSTPINPGFEALVFKASRGIEDIYELTYIRKDGSRFPAVVSVTALRDAQEVIIGYLLIGTDNTARKQVEAEQKKLDQRLRDQQFYTRSLIESNVDALMTTDPAGIITDVNKQMEALTDCTRDELIGAPFKNYFTDPGRAEAAISRVLGEKKITNYELTVRARDGKQTEVSYNATTFYDRDRTLQGVFAAARDVTERKRLDRALREQNLELESARSVAERANLAKSDFLSSMSHELRSPLNAILGFAQLLDSDVPPPTPGQKESVGQILQAGWHLLKLINEILDLAKVESGQVPLSEEPVALGEVLSECHGMIEWQAQERGIKLRFSGPEAPIYVQADRTRLKQIVLNLLTNAVKYNQPLGSIYVEHHEHAPGRIRVSVTDTGVGLTPAQIGQLFQAFNRLGRESGEEEGTGIGLVVAKRLVELMGGRIGAESEVGVGSVFWFELGGVPAPELAIRPLKNAELGQTMGGGRDHRRTLLYVEDNPANLRLVQQIVARNPELHLWTAVTGPLGVESARLNRPEVILMDINLPGMNGFEAMRLLKSDPATAHIPVIALSANAMPRDVKKGMDAGFFRYLTKPINVYEFTEALDVALASSTKDSADREGDA